MKPKPLEPPAYPVKTGLLRMADPNSGSQIPFFLTSNDGTKLLLNFDKDIRPVLSLSSAEIVSWKSGVAGQGTDSSNAISFAVAGALFFWPMLLAAPFMIKNYTITGFEVIYIDEYGKDVPLVFATADNPISTMSLLKFSTGLESGQTRSTDVTNKLYERGLQNLTSKLRSERAKILVANSKKPWCSYIDLTKKTDDVKLYEQSLAQLTALNKKLRLPNIEDNSSKPSSEQWNAYLVRNPGLVAWSKAYPVQAIKLRECPSSKN